MKTTSGCTSSVRRLRRDVSGLELISERFSSGFGHSDMESTIRYLKPSRNLQTREKVNEIFA